MDDPIFSALELVGLAASSALAVWLLLKRHPVARALGVSVLLNVLLNLGISLTDYGFPDSWKRATWMTCFFVPPVLVLVWKWFNATSRTKEPWTPRLAFFYGLAWVFTGICTLTFLADSCAWTCTQGRAGVTGPLVVTLSLTTLVPLTCAFLLVRDTHRPSPLVDRGAALAGAVVILLRVVAYEGIFMASLTLGRWPTGTYLVTFDVISVMLGLGALGGLGWIAKSQWRAGYRLRAANVLIWSGVALCLGAIFGGFASPIVGSYAGYPYVLGGIGLTLALFLVLRTSAFQTAPIQPVAIGPDPPSPVENPPTTTPE